MLTGQVRQPLDKFRVPGHVEDVPRHVVADAARGGYTFSSLVLGLVESVPFRMRAAAEETEQGENP